MSTEKIRVIIADDHTIFVEGLTAILQKNMRVSIVQAFYNGEHLIQFLTENPESADVLILDINMPGTGGLECLDWLMKNRLPIKPIVLSMFNETFLIKKAVDSGALGFLVKNSGYNELISAIYRVSEGRTYLSANLKKKIEAEPEQIWFSPREIQIMNLLSQDLSSKQISEKLYISFNTVETHRKNLLRKSNSKTTAGLIKFGMANHLIKNNSAD